MNSSVVAKTDGSEWSDTEPASIVFERLAPPTYRKRNPSAKQ